MTEEYFIPITDVNEGVWSQSAEDEPTIPLDEETENCDDPPLVHGEDDPVEAKTEDKIAALGPVVVSQVPHSGKKAASQ